MSWQNICMRALYTARPVLSRTFSRRDETSSLSSLPGGIRATSAIASASIDGSRAMTAEQKSEYVQKKKTKKYIYISNKN